MLVDSQDFTTDTPEETTCMRLWGWMADIDMLATRGELQLVEPVEQGSPILHFPELWIEADPASRSSPLKLLDYMVLIHLDRVIDYSTQPESSSDSLVSIHTDVSGMLTDSSLGGSPEWCYRSNLKFENGTFPPPRPSAHSRLRFPGHRGGGGAGGAGAGGAGGVSVKQRGSGAGGRSGVYLSK
ncbi:hypothetical protein ACQ4PT_067524 [Festuca glaucescens]